MRRIASMQLVRLHIAPQFERMLANGGVPLSIALPEQHAEAAIALQRQAGDRGLGDRLRPHWNDVAVVRSMGDGELDAVFDR